MLLRLQLKWCTVTHWQSPEIMSICLTNAAQLQKDYSRDAYHTAEVLPDKVWVLMYGLSYTHENDAMLCKLLLESGCNGN